MKRGILFVAVGMTVAGVASANVFTAVAPQPQSHETASPIPAQQASLLEAPAKPIAKAADPAQAADPAPAVKKASLETRQAPVPLQVKHRPPVNLPAVAPKAGETKAGETKSGEAKPVEAGPSQEAAASSGGFNENAAKAAIEADGYKGVRVLSKGANGMWHAKALRGKTEVLLAVDASGSVTTQ